MTLGTRERLMDAAIELFWKQSYGAVSVDDICTEAGVKKGSFYHFFPSKVDLMLECFEKMWADTKLLLDQVFSASQSPVERLKNYSELAYARQKEKYEKFGKVLGCPIATCGNELCTQDEKVRLKLNELLERHTRYFETLLRDAKAEGMVISDPETTAQKMFSYVMGVYYQAKIKNDLNVIRRDLLPGLMRYLDSRHCAQMPTERNEYTQPELV